MIERKRRQLICRVCSHPTCVITSLSLPHLRVSQLNMVGSGYDPAAWVSSRFGEHADQRQTVKSDADTGLFSQFADGGLFDGFVSVNEPSGEGPAAKKGLAASFDEQQLAVPCFSDDVSR
jgi:hypothetical protein